MFALTPAARFPLPSRTSTQRLPECTVILRATNDRVLRADGHSATELLAAIARLVPLDTYAEWNVAYMRHCECDEYPAITDEYTGILEKEEGENVKVVRLERFDFYEKAKKSRFVLATGEKALYANVIIKKGVVR